MTKVYEYVCRKCGARAELNYGKEGTRHLVEGRVCGIFRRSWSSVNVNRVPGGGRA